MTIDKATAAALLEFEKLGRFSDDTREALTKIVEPSSDDDKSSSTSKGASK